MLGENDAKQVVTFIGSMVGKNIRDRVGGHDSAATIADAAAKALAKSWPTSFGVVMGNHALVTLEV